MRHVVSHDPLLSERCTIQFVPDGSIAVDYIAGNGEYADRSRFPMPHLVLLDQRMRNMDGVEALAKIKAIPAGVRIPVCIMSTSSQQRLIEACYKTGAAFCVEKPLDFAELGPRLRVLVTFATEVLGLTH